ncbi:MAG: GNAT family N-acetyltransferase [Candidatus Diapherotrites archaeon]
MKIRKATKKDLNKIGKLMLKEFSKQPFNEKDSLKDVLKSLSFYFQNAEIYISEIEKEIVGIIIFQIEQWWEGPIIIIQDLAVKKEFYKQNIGKELMDFIEKYAKNKKAKRIYFETNKKSSAIKFYKKIGYKINKERISMSKKIK